MSSITLAQLAQELVQRDGFLIITHRRPDGDTIGSAAALCRLLRQLGKRAFVHPNEDASARYGEYIFDLYPQAGDTYDTLVAVDIADESLFLPSCRGFAGRVDICIDHHPSNKLYAGLSHVRASACAVGEIIWQLAGALGLAPGQEALKAIYLAISTDTGCFLFSSTTPLAHEIAARCIEAGVDFHGINTEFFRKKSKGRFEIERALTDGLRLGPGGLVAGACLTLEMIDTAGATEDDMDNLASLIINMEGVQCAVLVTQLRAGGCKASVRTAAPLDASGLCARFGGGGHARAAGCSFDGDPHDALSRLMQAAQAQLEAQGDV